MSARSIKRAHARAEKRQSIARRAALGTAAALGAGAIAASGAQAADFQVSNIDDLGAGSLRQALQDAQSSPADDTISFTAAATGRIELTTKLPDVTGGLAINGPGASKLTVDGNDTNLIFNISSPTVVPVSISGLTITGGKAAFNPKYDGGAIHSSGADLTVADAVIDDNYAKEYGGGIWADDGTLTIRDSTLSNNTANNGYGGGVYLQDTPGTQPVEVIITGSKFLNNDAGNDGGGGYFASVDNDVTVRNTTVTGNKAGDDGGGFVFGGGDGSSNAVLVDSSTFANNTAANSAGGVWFLDPSQSETVLNSTFTDNTAEEGGGIYDDSDSEVPTTIDNSTIVGNHATSVGGGIFQNNGDAVNNFTISSSVVSGNTAPTGTDLGDDGSGGFTIGNSLIGTLTGPTAPIVQTPAGTNKIGGDPQLSALSDNGGPTPTMAPALSSPLIDAGVANGNAVDQRGLARTVIQPVPLSAGSDGTDIGAVELRDGSLEGAKVSAKKKQKQKGKKVVIKVTAGAAEAVTIDASGVIKLGKKQVKLKPVTAQGTTDQQLTLTLKPAKKNSSKKVLKTLAAGKKAKASLAVTFTDKAGNTDTENAKVTLKGAKPKKK